MKVFLLFLLFAQRGVSQGMEEEDGRNSTETEVGGGEVEDGRNSTDVEVAASLGEGGCGCALLGDCADGSGLIKPRHPEENGTTWTSTEVVNSADNSSAAGDDVKIPPKCGDGFVFCCHIVTSTAPPPPPVCGVQKTQDVPGFNPAHPQLAAYGEFPWLVRVVDANYRHIASGVLVSSTKVLTVAHSLYPYANQAPAYVYLGEWNSAVSVVPHKPLVIPVETYVTHPAFNYVNLRNDIAVIHLASPYDDMRRRSYDNPQIGSVCLGRQFNPEKCWLATFGDVSGDATPIIHKVKLPLVESGSCEQTFRRSILGRGFILNRRSFVCAGGQGHGDACIGHGGAPLVCEGQVEGQFLLAGLVSWGLTETCPPPPGETVLPGVYTNVASYLEWIEATPPQSS